MPPHSDQRDERRLRDATEEEQQQQHQHLLSLDDTMAPETSTSSSSSAQQRLEEKRREAEGQSPAAAPASERLGVQVYAALSSSLMTGQSVAAASFGSIAVDHIQRGVGAVDATDSQLTFFCE